jgi:phosphoserine phosphatase RsbU/P
LLPDTDERGATSIAQKIQQAIEKLNIPHAASPLEMKKITISIGICSLHPSKKITTDFFVRCADQALYQAKKEGRSRYYVYSNI